MYSVVVSKTKQDTMAEQAIGDEAQFSRRGRRWVKDKKMAARYTEMADMYEAGSRGSVDVVKSLRLGESAGARVRWRICR